VNWFRRDEEGRFLWPGFGENMRILKWIIDRVHGRGYGVESPIGYMPRYEDISWEGLDFDSQVFNELLTLDREEWLQETRAHEVLFDMFYDRLPNEFVYLREMFKSRLYRSPDVWRLPGNKASDLCVPVADRT
jgi:phosphoenolpyruvate carboxykinase (GTP)